MMDNKGFWSTQPIEKIACRYATSNFVLQSCFYHVNHKIYLWNSYAIGGLAGGEDKDSFWRVVAQCTASLPENKPRYVMVLYQLTYPSFRSVI